MGNPQTGEQLHQKRSHTVAKVLGPTTDFPTWGSSKGIENPQGTWLRKSAGFDYSTSTGLGENNFLKGRNKILCTPGPRRKEQWPHKRLKETYQWVSGSLQQRHRSTVTCHWVGVLTTTVLRAKAGWHKSFGRRLPLLALTASTPSIVWEEHSTTHQQKIGLKIYWVCPCSPESTKGYEMQYLDAISKMIEWSLFVYKANHSISQ